MTRMRNKLMIQMERGFAVDPDIVLMCMIHRISEQKGFQLLLEASEGLFRNLDIRPSSAGPYHQETGAARSWPTAFTS